MTDATSIDAVTAGQILALTGGVLLVIGILGILWYIFQALGIYTMAKNRGLDHKWFAWIPYLQNYLFGELIDDKVWGFGGAKWLLLLIPLVIGGGGAFIPYDNSILVGTYSIISFIGYVYTMTAYYRLYKFYSNHPVAYTIFTIIFPILGPIFIFINRNHPYRRPLDIR